MERLKNKKVYVGKYSREIQEKAFELGFKWVNNNTKPLNLDRPFLYFYDDGFIGSGSDVNVFNNNTFKEVTPEYILSLETKPKWKDFGKVEGYYVNGYSKVEYYFKDFSFEENANVFPTKEEAEACLALSQLLQWRDEYNEGWKPDWSDNNSLKYIMEYNEDKIQFDTHTNLRRVLTFKSAEIRDKFLKDFKELIEVAKPLL